MMTTAIRAELTKQGHRSASWLLLGIGTLLTVTFGYLVPYVGLSDGSAARGLDAMLPGNFVGAAVGGLPVFVGALALIFGVLVAGSEYGYEAWKAVLVQDPSRVRVYTAKLATIAAGTLTGVLVLFTATALCSVGVASLEDQAIVWPSAVDIATGLGGAWLMATMWAALGVALAIVLRSVALPIGLGLVWMLAVQNLLAAITAPLVPAIADLQKYLPGPNAGALAASLGASQQAPGVDAIVGAGHATIAVAAYLVAFCGIGGWPLHRRDIT